MRVLVVKTSSLGDLIHTFPALTDAAGALPDIEFHWLAEAAFSEVPTWHPAVRRVIPIEWRKWRRQFWAYLRDGTLRQFVRTLRDDSYDLVIDAQGLLKSAIPARFARGKRIGYAWDSAREPFASRFYQQRITVDRNRHAIARNRELFARALGYSVPEAAAEYGIDVVAKQVDERPYLVFLHATTWASKHWPEPYWGELARIATDSGYRVYFPWGTAEDRLQAERIIAASRAGGLLPGMKLTELAACLRGAAGVVGVDSGLAHITAAMATPAITLYGPTRVELTGALGPAQRNLRALYPCAPCMHRDCVQPLPREPDPPCFLSLPPGLVFAALQTQMAEGRG